MHTKKFLQNAILTRITLLYTWNHVKNKISSKKDTENRQRNSSNKKRHNLYENKKGSENIKWLSWEKIRFDSFPLWCGEGDQCTEEIGGTEICWSGVQRANIRVRGGNHFITKKKGCPRRTNIWLTCEREMRNWIYWIIAQGVINYMSAYFQVYKDNTEKYRWMLKDPNHKIIAVVVKDILGS